MDKTYPFGSLAWHFQKMSEEDYRSLMSEIWDRKQQKELEHNPDYVWVPLFKEE